MILFLFLLPYLRFLKFENLKVRENKSARKFLIFAHFRFSTFKNLRYGNRNEKQQHFCENFNWDLFLCAKLKKFGTNFRANPGPARYFGRK